MSASFATLIDYWFGELPPAEEATFEEHFFGCGECTEALSELVALGAAVGAAFREGTVSAVISHPLYEAMKREGLRLREYHVASGAGVQCTILETDDFVISRLKAPLAGVRRVDLVTSSGRFEDVPFDAESGDILSIPAPARLKRRGAFTDHVRLLAVEDAGERVLGEYTFFHSPG